VSLRVSDLEPCAPGAESGLLVEFFGEVRVIDVLALFRKIRFQGRQPPAKVLVHRFSSGVANLEKDISRRENEGEGEHPEVQESEPETYGSHAGSRMI
jgi:hypothetical protein